VGQRPGSYTALGGLVCQLIGTDLWQISCVRAERAKLIGALCE
jgi:hypothetical protein